MNLPAAEEDKLQLPPWDGDARLAWSDDAPKSLVRHTVPGAEGDGWRRWVKHLADRRKARPLFKALCKTLSGRKSPLAWAAPAGVEHSALLQYEFAGKKKAAGGDKNAAPQLSALVADWMRTSSLAVADRIDDPIFALECLALARALPRLASDLDHSAWWTLLDRLIGLAERAPTSFEGPALQGAAIESPVLAAQLLEVELPLTLAAALPELRRCHGQAERGHRALVAAFEELHDGEGMLRASELAGLRSLVATWTRSLALAAAIDKRLADKHTRRHLAWLVRESLRLTRHEGSQALAPDAPAWTRKLLQAALSLADRRADERLARLVLPKLAAGEKDSPGKSKSKGLAKAKSLGDELGVSPSNHSEWAQVALLRSGWGRREPMLAVDYHGAEVAIDLSADGQPLLVGQWQFEATVDGRTLRPLDWTDICWQSDDDVDYLELQCTLAEGIMLQRQMLLAREDRILFLCDSVMTSGARQIAYRGSLPLAAGVAWAQTDETREGVLVADVSPRARIMPLALPEWRIDPRGGTFDATGDELILSQRALGRNLACPLFIDLDPRRTGHALTWRQLTVGENLAIVPAETAVGYRAQVGREQWLFYRSLNGHANRTVLGQNIWSEFIATRFDSNGDAEELITIDSREEEGEE